MAKKKNAHRKFCEHFHDLAEADGIEPSPRVSETPALPLRHASVLRIKA